MKILLTGENGYISKTIFDNLKDSFEITKISRKNFDLSNYKLLDSYLKHKYFDVVIHCAVSGGLRVKSDTWDVMDNNLQMYYNLLNCKDRFNKLIHFGSGAEVTMPETPYGLSKKVISKSISEIDNFYNIRIFSVFDENELDSRFMKTNIKKYINKEPIIIYQDKFMDFFYMKDLISIVDYYIKESNPLKTMECSYNLPHKLSEIADIINNLNNYKVDVIIENKEMGLNYCGKNDLFLNYIGLTNGIKEVYNKYISI
jgi:UDP-glucose 4-epimerase